MPTQMKVPESSGTLSSKTLRQTASKIVTACVLIAGIAILFMWLRHDVSPRQGGKDRSVGNSSHTSVASETGTVLATGIFVLKSDSMTTFKIGVGENVCVAPLIDVDIDWYINGTLVREIRKSGSRTYHNAQNMWVREVGYVLREQGMSEVQVAYVKYTGSAPPNGWFDTAQTKAKADGITAIN